MPNYWYRCYCCKLEEQKILPISYDPSILLYCSNCDALHLERIIKSTPLFKMEKTTLGEWFKGETGKDLLG